MNVFIFVKKRLCVKELVCLNAFVFVSKRLPDKTSVCESVCV